MGASGRPARLIIAVAAALLAAYAILWAGVGTRNIGRSDFTSFYVGGSLLRAGHRGDLYSESVQQPLHSALIAPDRESNLPFVDAPPAAALVAPVTALPLQVAYRAWGALEVLILLFAALIAASSAPWRAGTSAWWKAAAVAASMAGMGTWTVLVQAQWTPFVALGLALAYRDWKNGHEMRGAALLVVVAGFAKPHLTLALIAFAIGWRSRRVLAGALSGALVLGIASLALVGTTGLLGFAHLAASDATRWDLRDMLSFVGIPGAIWGNGAAAHVAGAVGSLIACAVAWRLGALVRADRTRLAAALTGAAVLSLLAAPHAYPHDLVMLSPALIWGVAAATRSRLVGRTRAGTAMAIPFAAWTLINFAAFVDFSDNVIFPPGQLTAWALIAAAVIACAEAGLRPGFALRARGRAHDPARVARATQRQGRSAAP